MKGAWQICRWRGVPVSIHWSAPIGFLAFTGFSVQPLAWLVLAGIILMHEWGHATLIRRFGFHVESIVLQGNGGECAWAGHASRREHAIIAWGGVLGQLPALFLGVLLRMALPMSAPGPLREAGAVLVEDNVILICLNLLPIPSLDGFHAWRLFAPDGLGALLAGPRVRAFRARARAALRKLSKRDRR